MSAPSVVIVINPGAMAGPELRRFGETLWSLYQQDVLPIIAHGDDTIQVYGAEMRPAPSLVELAEALVDDFDEKDRQRLYEKLNKMGHRMR
jgi:hypothetical protein